jgi:hypothetical protein
MASIPTTKTLLRIAKATGHKLVISFQGRGDGGAAGDR